MSDLIDNLFRRFAAVYGNRFTRMWDGLDIADIKAQWASELGGLSPEAVRHALNHLPESMPPTLLEFKKLALNAPRQRLPELPGPKPDLDRVNREVAKLKSQDGGFGGPKAWALGLKLREKSGQPLTLFQRAAWREALRADLNSSAIEVVDDTERVQALKAEAARRVAEYTGAT